MGKLRVRVCVPVGRVGSGRVAEMPDRQAPSMYHRLHGVDNKKLSCRRETARCFVSLNISL